MIKICNLYLIIILFLIILYVKYKFLEKDLVNNSEKDIFILNNFLSYDDFTKLQNLLKNIKNKNRQDNFLRKGSSISHFEMNDELSEIKDIFRDPKILVKIKEETGINLQLVTRFDSNQISLLFYNLASINSFKSAKGRPFIASKLPITLLNSLNPFASNLYAPHDSRGLSNATYSSISLSVKLLISISHSI